MEAKLYVIPGSHPAHSARLMLERKGIPYKRRDLIPFVSKAALKAIGFDDVTVPAVKLDGRRFQGTRVISRALDEVRPEPPLFPAEGSRREAVEEAERWGDEVLQSVPRRVVWNILARDSRGRRSYLEGAKLGLPVAVAAKTSKPLVLASRRFNDASDENVRADIAALPAHLDHVDALIGDGTLDASDPNAADFQIAPTVRLLMTLEDIRPAIEGRPAADHAMRLLPEFPGYAPRALPDEWLEPLRRG